MKKGIFLRIIITVLALGLFAGCGGSSSSSSSKQITTTPIQNFPNVINDFRTNDASSVTINLTNIHPDLSSHYARLDMELSIGTVIGNHDDLDAHQAGDIVIHKTQFNGFRSQSYFTSGGNTLDDVKENFWKFNSNNKLVWRGAFEGPTGTLVVIVDGIFSAGDGNGPLDLMSGSVWFRPWPVVADEEGNPNQCYIKNGRIDCKNPSGPLTRCWDVSIGPYDCRFDVSSDYQSVTTIGNAYTESVPYTKIAEFNDLSRERTFKETY